MQISTNYYVPNFKMNSKQQNVSNPQFKAGEGELLVKLLEENKGNLSPEQLNVFIKDNFSIFTRSGVKDLLEKPITYIAGLAASIASLTAANTELEKEKQNLEATNQQLIATNKKQEAISSLKMDTKKSSDLEDATKWLDKLGINYKIDKDNLLIVDRLELNISKGFYDVRDNKNKYITVYPLLGGSESSDEGIYKVFHLIKRIENDLVIKNGRAIIDKDSGYKRTFNDFDVIRDENGHDAVVSGRWAHLQPYEIEEIMRGERVPGKIIPIDFSNLESINGNMECSWSWIRAPKLKTIGGNAIINHCTADLSQVETVGNNLQICGKSYVCDNIFDKDDSYIYSRLETNSQMGNLRSIGGWMRVEAPSFPKLKTIENREIDWRRNYDWHKKDKE